MGCILTGIGVILLALKGFSAPLVGILVIGIILAVVGLFGHRERKQKASEGILNSYTLLVMAA